MLVVDPAAAGLAGHGHGPAGELDELPAVLGVEGVEKWSGRRWRWSWRASGEVGRVAFRGLVRTAQCIRSAAWLGGAREAWPSISWPDALADPRWNRAVFARHDAHDRRAEIARWRALRAILARLVRGPVSGVGWRALTCLVQSSSATTMTTIGFVSAGLLSFPQAIGVIFGRTSGRRARVDRVAAGVQVLDRRRAQPLIFVGVVLRLLGRDRVARWAPRLPGSGCCSSGWMCCRPGWRGW